MEKGEAKKDEVKDGVIEGRERWRLWTAMSRSCVAPGCAQPSRDKKGLISPMISKFFFHKCPNSKRREVEKDEEKKEEVWGGVIQRRERWRLWIAMSPSCVASGCA